MKIIAHKVTLIVLLIIAGCSSMERTTVTPSAETKITEFYSENYVRYHDRVYQDNIRSVKLHKVGFTLSMPIIELNSPDKLFLSFDDLDGDVKSYRYEIIHCDANWNPSDLFISEYTDGFDNGLIEDYAFSFNTMEGFTHYTLRFPKAGEVTPTLSGNYILAVYESGKRDQPVLTRRFMIYESKVSIHAIVNQASDPQKQFTHHEIDFNIQPGNYYIEDPSRHLIIKVMQNQRWDTQVKNLKPKNIMPDKLDYNYEGKIVFRGLNEFRFFDTRSLRHQTPGVDRIYHDSLGNHVELEKDQINPYGSYVSVEDINGRSYIISYDVNREKELEADYAWIHFTLPYPAPLTDGSIYIMGELSDWQFQDKARMQYDARAKAYRASLYLKQGYYNYQYVFLANGADRGDASRFEGQHYETENDYTIFVYHRAAGADYDKLIAVEKINSGITEK
ncbi:MAG: DUF5103 domain-containing protein [Bacteroidales bacterium]